MNNPTMNQVLKLLSDYLFLCRSDVLAPRGPGQGGLSASVGLGRGAALLQRYGECCYGVVTVLLRGCYGVVRGLLESC